MKNRLSITIEHHAIPTWSREDKPREKLIDKGPQALTSTELLALTICKGTNNKTAIDLAREIMRIAENDLGVLTRMNVQQLQQIPGIGPAKASQIIAALELGRRKHAGEPVRDITYITSNVAAARYMMSIIGHLDQEQFYVIHLKNNNQLLHVQHVGTGSITATIVDPRIILSKALELRATRIILCHNHPSGSLRPSEADIHLTERLRYTTNMFSIELLEHLIVSDKGYCGIIEKGYVDKPKKTA